MGPIIKNSPYDNPNEAAFVTPEVLADIKKYYPDKYKDMIRRRIEWEEEEERLRNPEYRREKERDKLIKDAREKREFKKKHGFSREEERAFLWQQGHNVDIDSLSEEEYDQIVKDWVKDVEEKKQERADTNRVEQQNIDSNSHKDSDVGCYLAGLLGFVIVSFAIYGFIRLISG
jgi:hypothetical protein